MELNPDIQIGRNVYVDTTRLAADEDYAAQIAAYVAEGFYPIEGTPEDALRKISMS